MLEVGTFMTPINVHEDISYTQLSDMVTTYISEKTDDICGQSPRGFWVRWERNDQQSPFPERTRIDKDNVMATITLMRLRGGRDILEVDYASDSPRW